MVLAGIATDCRLWRIKRGCYGAVVEENSRSKRIFSSGTTRVKERSQKSLIFANGIPVQESVDFFDTLNDCITENSDTVLFLLSANKRAVLRINRNYGIRRQVARENLFGNKRFKRALQISAQRTGAVNRIVAAVYDK